MTVLLVAELAFVLAFGVLFSSRLQLQLVLKHTVVFFHLRELLLERFD